VTAPKQQHQGAIYVDYMALSKLVPATSNPKKHNFEELQASVKRFGFTQPLLMNEKDGRLVAGHGRMETLQQLKAAGGSPPGRVQVSPDGEWLVPVLRGVSFTDEAEAKAYLLADNRLTEIGGWDDAALSEMLKELEDVNGLVGVGFTVSEVDKLLKSSDPDVAGATGDSPEEKFQRFQNADIKQVVLYFEGAEYDRVVARLAAIQAEHKLATNTDAVLLLLDRYEGGAPTAGK
jgi:hypothetical protein